MSTISDFFKEKKEDITDVLDGYVEKIKKLSEDISKSGENSEEIVVSDEEEPKEDPKTVDSLKQIKDSLDAYSKMTASNKDTKVYSGQNLMGTPSSMSPYGPSGQMSQIASPYFSDLASNQRSALENLNTQISALQKLLKGGVNV